MADKIGSAYSVERRDIEEFVVESLAISGIREGKNGDYAVLKKRYFEISTYQLEIPRLMLPLIVNDGLLNGISPRAGQYRTGIPALDHDLMPKSEHIRTLTERWYEDAVRCIQEHWMRGEATKKRKARELFFTFLCLRPFIEANGRTARLLYNSIRVRLGLPWMVMHYDTFREDVRESQRFRIEKFVPQYKQYL